MSDETTRRRWLAGLAGASTAALSGCVGTIEGAVGGDGGDASGLRDGTVERGAVPPYASLVPVGEGTARLTAFDLETDENHVLGALPEEPTDPLRFDAASGAVAARVVGNFLLGLGDSGFSPDRFEIGASTHLVGVDGVGAQLMPVDVDGLRSDAAENDLETRLNEGDRLVFRGRAGNAFGATPDTFVVGPAEAPFDPLSRVRRVVEARAGATERLVEADDAFRSLLATGETSGSVACAYAGDGTVESLVASTGGGLSVEFLTSGFGTATGAVAQLTTANGDPPQPATMTIEFPDGGAIDGDALTGSLGTAAGDTASVRDGTTVRVSGTYTWDDLAAFDRGGQGVGAN